MRTLIVCTSVSHGNTQRVAQEMGQVLDAKVVAPEQVDEAELNQYDLVGFGSGIFNLAFHRDLRDFINSLGAADRGNAFVFYTSGLPEPPFRRYSRKLAQLLEHKGFTVVDSFSCRAWDTAAPFKPFGGVSKGHPDTADLAAARSFAEGLTAA